MKLENEILIKLEMAKGNILETKQLVKMFMDGEICFSRHSIYTALEVLEEDGLIREGRDIIYLTK